MSARAATGFAFLVLGCCLCGFTVLSQAQQRPPQRPAPAASRQVHPASETARPAPMTPAQQEETRGDIFMARKMYRKAIETYQDVLLARGVPVHVKQRKRNFFQRLFGFFRRPRLPQNPANAKLMDKIGIAYQELGDDNQAETYYKRSAESDKHFASPLNNLGTVEFGRKNYKNAVNWYAKSIKVDPRAATTFSNMGYAYLAWNKYQEAIDAFRQAVLLDPTVFQHRGNLASVIEARGGAKPGLYYYTLAKTFAMLGNAERCAHFLKMSRDEGYKKFRDALKDPAFRPVLKDSRVQAILSSSSAAPGVPGRKH